MKNDWSCLMVGIIAVILLTIASEYSNKVDIRDPYRGEGTTNLIQKQNKREKLRTEIEIAGGVEQYWKNRPPEPPFEQRYKAGYYASSILIFLTYAVLIIPFRRKSGYMRKTIVAIVSLIIFLSAGYYIAHDSVNIMLANVFLILVWFSGAMVGCLFMIAVYGIKEDGKPRG